MKRTHFTLIFLLLAGFTTMAQTPKSRYEKGFSFYDYRGAKMTLVKWTNVGQGFGYRWTVKVEWLGVTADGWTDDQWIDLYTGKCFLNERTHQMVYYDSVIITPIKKKP